MDDSGDDDQDDDSGIYYAFIAVFLAVLSLF